MLRALVWGCVLVRLRRIVATGFILGRGAWSPQQGESRHIVLICAQQLECWRVEGALEQRSNGDLITI